MKRFWGLIAAIGFATSAIAQEWPAVIGTISNRAGGEIVLTGEVCAADKTKFFVYIRDSGGKISGTGCWTFKQGSFWVFWDDGEVFNYDYEAFKPTSEFETYMEDKDGVRS